MALILFRTQPTDAREVMIELFRERLHTPPAVRPVAKAAVAEK